MMPQGVGRSSIKDSSRAGQPGAGHTVEAAARAGIATLPLAPAARPHLRGVEGPLLSRRAAACLRVISQQPGSSSAQAQAALGIRHPSQISKLLHRLERDGLIHTERGARALNAWRLTEHGRATLEALPEGIYAE